MQLKYTCAVVVLAAGLSGTQSATAQTTKPSSPPKQAAETQERKPGAGIKDAWVTMKIHSQFIPEDALEDSNIDVDTNNGVVTLSGTVASEAGRTRAVAIAKATDGVKSVNDNLKIAPAVDKTSSTARGATGAAKAGGRRVTDGWIKSKIYAQFLGENALEDSDIDIGVRDGNVTLSGTVPSEAGRTRAVAIAKATDGVKNVKDGLKVGKP